MKDEIKEILDIFISQYDSTISIDYIDSLGKKNELKDINGEDLLDYITNLQEENETLKEYQESYRKELDYWRIQFSNKKGRIEKAIEYINSKHNWYGDEEEDNEDYLFELENFEDLLNILTGEENDR